MNQDDYQGSFRMYESARRSYEEVQDRIQHFLGQFTGHDEADEDPFEVGDLATMEGLRAERDRRFEEYRTLEKDVFNRLSAAWLDLEPGKRFRVDRTGV